MGRKVGKKKQKPPRPVECGGVRVEMEHRSAATSSTDQRLNVTEKKTNLTHTHAVLSCPIRAGRSWPAQRRASAKHSPDHPAWIPLALPPVLPVLTPKKTPDLAVLQSLRFNMSTCHHFGPTAPGSRWFLQVKAHFRLRQITSQQTRYWHLVSCLPPDVADDLADILASPHLTHPYDTLKAAIISRKSESEHSRLQQLITATELGDRRPSQLLRRMRKLLGGPSAPQEEKLLHELFLQHLPQKIVPVLVASGDVPVDTFAETAD
ncbi:hypothetical protein HPB51_020446 [Rhipicephalus microplus]|uniref:DUF7041 domain-containing protein n=1 Tax=Rhipicephalus microplus TaxID=6941 RepID=A0A9J6DCG9_RHIMP|nr:hypothetical protein HPB51_020446 [Rhipicephalus microplus]